jgi:hypothetical protein
VGDEPDGKRQVDPDRDHGLRARERHRRRAAVQVRQVPHPPGTHRLGDLAGAGPRHAAGPVAGMRGVRPAAAARGAAEPVVPAHLRRPAQGPAGGHQRRHPGDQRPGRGAAAPGPHLRAAARPLRLHPAAQPGLEAAGAAVRGPAPSRRALRRGGLQLPEPGGHVGGAPAAAAGRRPPVDRGLPRPGELLHQLHAPHPLVQHAHPERPAARRGPGAHRLGRVPGTLHRPLRRQVPDASQRLRPRRPAGGGRRRRPTTCRRRAPPPARSPGGRGR